METKSNCGGRGSSSNVEGEKEGGRTLINIFHARGQVMTPPCHTSDVKGRSEKSALKMKAFPFRSEHVALNGHVSLPPHLAAESLKYVKIWRAN